jgi:hypothetical protein
MPPFRTRPIRANPHRQGSLRIYVNDGDRASDLKWEYVPYLEAFGLAEDGVLAGIPGHQLGRCWWTPNQMHFSLAHKSSLNAVQISPNRFRVGKKNYLVPPGFPLPNLNDSPETLALELEKSVRATLADSVEVGDISQDVVPGMNLVTMRDKHKTGLLWVLCEPGTTLIRGAGRLVSLPTVECIVTSASLEESLQGKGHYVRILKYMRMMTGADVYSDNSLSLQAIIAWKKMGKIANAKGDPLARFKLNNPPNRAETLYRLVLRDTILTRLST